MNKKIIGIIAVVVIIVVAYFVYDNYKEVDIADKNQTEEVETIKIGAILPLTGPGSVFANYIKDGLDLALKNVNESSKKYRYEIFYEDSKNQPKQGIIAYKKLITSDNADVIVVALSSVAEAIKHFANNDKIPQIGIAVATPDYTINNNFVFRVYPNSNTMAGNMANFNINTLNQKRGGIIYINDAFGLSSLNSYKEISVMKDSEIVLEDNYSIIQKDFKSIIAKIKQIKPDVIYLNGYGPAYSTFIKQLYATVNYDFKLTADMTLGLPITKIQLKEVQDVIYYVDGNMSDTFYSLFKKEYNKEASSYSGYAFDIIKLINKTIDDGSILHSENRSLYIQENLLKIKNFQGAMGNITISKEGDSNLEFNIKIFNEK